MSKRKKKKQSAVNNLVAKVAHLFNRCTTFEDKTKYKRKPKHKSNYDD